MSEPARQPDQRLSDLLERATPRPWTFSDSTDRRGHKGEFRAPNPYNGFMLVGPWINDADAELIVAAVNALPGLLAAERQLTSLREAERIDLEHGFALPGDSALAVAFRGLDELDADQQDSE